MTEADVRLDRGLLFAILAVLFHMDVPDGKLWLFTLILAMANIVLAFGLMVTAGGDAE